MELQADYHDHTILLLLLHPIKSQFIRVHTVTPLYLQRKAKAVP